MTTQGEVNEEKSETINRRILKIIEALQTTQNLESHKYKLNEFVNIHLTKLNNSGTRLMLQYEASGHIISNFTGTIEEVKKELYIED